MKYFFTEKQLSFIAHADSQHLSAVEDGYGSLWLSDAEEESTYSSKVMAYLQNGAPLLALTANGMLEYILFAIGEYEALRDDGLCGTYYPKSEENRLAGAIRRKYSQLEKLVNGKGYVDFSYAEDPGTYGFDDHVQVYSTLSFGDIDERAIDEPLPEEALASMDDETGLWFAPETFDWDVVCYLVKTERTGWGMALTGRFTVNKEETGLTDIGFERAAKKLFQNARCAAKEVHAYGQFPEAEVVLGEKSGIWNDHRGNITTYEHELMLIYPIDFPKDKFLAAASNFRSILSNYERTVPEV